MEAVKKVKMVGEGVGFERIRRITGYLVGTTERFNNAKKAEEQDRVKHTSLNIQEMKEMQKPKKVQKENKELKSAA